MIIGDNWKTATFKDIEDDWGYVCFPKGPKADTYTVTKTSSYSKEEAEDIAFVLNLWMSPPPGYDGPEDWKSNLYPSYRDERTVYETQVIAREPGVAKIGYEHVMGIAVNANTLINQIYINGNTPAEAVEAVAAQWQSELNKVNGK
ncbi:hypothetical protein AN641_08175 [Candidatus Epulonipiscioides gigas]|nr:hypothetical protein AN641_08175 [Epulopiscium sp. SCG-C07WGA-EpuloA2]